MHTTGTDCLRGGMVVVNSIYAREPVQTRTRYSLRGVLEDLPQEYSVGDDEDLKICPCSIHRCPTSCPAFQALKRFQQPLFPRVVTAISQARS